ncbi:MAG: c-type cytochrome, partial [Acidimicrobiia bacterium]
MRFQTLIGIAVALTGLLSAAAACNGNGGQDLAVQGRSIAQARACTSCHTTDGTSSVGPTWKNLYGSRVPLDDSSEVIADDAYLRESILDPSAKTVKDFEKGRME